MTLSQLVAKLGSSLSLRTVGQLPFQNGAAAAANGRTSAAIVGTVVGTPTGAALATAAGYGAIAAAAGLAPAAGWRIRVVRQPDDSRQHSTGGFWQCWNAWAQWAQDEGELFTFYCPQHRA